MWMVTWVRVEPVARPTLRPASRRDLPKCLEPDFARQLGLVISLFQRRPQFGNAERRDFTRSLTATPWTLPTAETPRRRRRRTSPNIRAH
jgi:hypothetical protein